jgi:hypothetical protein
LCQSLAGVELQPDGGGNRDGNQGGIGERLRISTEPGPRSRLELPR